MTPSRAARLALDPDRRRRAEIFPCLASGHHFNHAAVSAVPRPTADAIHEAIDQIATDGSASWSRLSSRVESARGSLAAFLGTARERVALLKNTTEALVTVARGLDWKAGDSVVILDGDFPSNVFPWLILADRGVEVRRVRRAPGRPVTVEDVLSSCDSRTRLVALSLVAYDDGARHPVEEIAEQTLRRGIYLSVDAIQGLGALPFSATVPGIDAVAADGHKWLLSVEGAAVLALSDRLQEHLDVLTPGWTSVLHPEIWSFQTDRLDWKPGASRFEGGTLNTLGFIGLGASVDLLGEIGMETIWARLDLLCECLSSALVEAGHRVVSSRADGQRSGIVSFVPRGGGNVGEIASSLASANVHLAARQGLLRAAPHFYLDDSDIEALIEALDLALT